MASKNKYSNVKKLYDYLQKSKIVNISENLAETKFRDFYSVWNQTPVKIKNILIHAYNHNITNLHQIITIDRPDAPSALFDSAESYTLGFTVAKGKVPKVQLGLFMLKMPSAKFASTPMPKHPFIRRLVPVNPKWISLDPSYKYQGKEIQLTDLWKENELGEESHKIGDIIRKLADRLYDMILYMKGKNAQIDSSFLDHWDKMVLWYATYVSDKSPGGFMGYVVTWEKVQNTVAEKGFSVLNHIKIVKEMDDVVQKSTGKSSITPELVQAFESFTQQLNDVVMHQFPKNYKVYINLGEWRDWIRMKRFQETGDDYVKGLGFTQWERDSFSQVEPFHEILGIGLTYLDKFVKLFEVTKELRAAIDSSYSTKNHKIYSRWSKRVVARWIPTTNND